MPLPVSVGALRASGALREASGAYGDLRGKDGWSIFCLQPIFLAWLNLHLTKGKNINQQKSL